MKIISGTSNKKLAEKIAYGLGILLSERKIKRFADDEIYVKIEDELNQQDVVIVQSTSSNDYLMELLLLINAVRMHNPKTITAVIPYFGYARQDRVVEKGEALSSRLVAQLLQVAGVSKVITVDIHSPRIKEYFDIEFIDLDATKIFTAVKADVIVAADQGALEKAKMLAEVEGLHYCAIDKIRTEHNKVQDMQLCHEVEGKVCVLIDDMIDTGGTIAKAASLLKEMGASEVKICATHGIFSKDALEKLKGFEIDVTDTLDNENIKILSVAPLIIEELK